MKIDAIQSGSEMMARKGKGRENKGDSSTGVGGSSNKIYVGVAAMDTKARSKPMKNILNRLLSSDDAFEVVIFGDNVILEENIEDWPRVDCLISFYSSGFPLQKAISYASLRKPFCINDLPLQQVLLDRRLVLEALDVAGVSTVQRWVVNRGDNPMDGLSKLAQRKFMAILARKGAASTNYTTSTIGVKTECVQLDYDTLLINNEIVKKPFVEKPVDGENHNINIYFAKSNGGGARKLFRKVGNKSSEYDPEAWRIREDGSYVYEEFVEVDNMEDVKVYTCGQSHLYAETRKSPVVDGIVCRTCEGKEVRYVTELSDGEAAMARKVCAIFEQSICGLDMLRYRGKSYVIDVNGWSFVKGNDNYYDMAAETLSKTFKRNALQRRLRISPEPSNVDANARQWRLKGFISVFRHADRTPKQKLKFRVQSAPFLELFSVAQDRRMGPPSLGAGESNEALEETNDETTTLGAVILRSQEELRLVDRACERALELGIESKDQILQLREVLARKSSLPGTKVQLKPTSWVSSPLKFDDSCSPTSPNTVAKAQLVIKWGGEFTHAGAYHSRELGESLRKEILIMNKKVLDDVSVKTSSERRVVATSVVVTSALLGDSPSLAGNAEDVTRNVSILKNFPKLPIIEDTAMLDDNFRAKDELDSVKRQLSSFLQSNNLFEDHPELKDDIITQDEFHRNPKAFFSQFVAILAKHRTIFRRNYAKFCKENTESSQWCTLESPVLFRERWERIFKEFCEVPIVDPSRIPELHDSLKYDALHNRAFLEAMFVQEEDLLWKELDTKSPIISPEATDGQASVSPPSVNIEAAEMNEQAIRRSDSYRRLYATSFEQRRFKSSAMATEPSPLIDSLRMASATSLSNPLLRPRRRTATLPRAHPHQAANIPVDAMDSLTSFRELFRRANILYNFISPQEYGITNMEKRCIGRRTTGLLLHSILRDLRYGACEEGYVPSDGEGYSTPFTRLYFSKESHVHSLLNVILFSGIPTRFSRSRIEELDYLTQITFELYERTLETPATTPTLAEALSNTSTKTSAKKRYAYALRVGFSPGANNPSLVDLELDEHHAILPVPRIWLTDYVTLDDALSYLQNV